MVCFDCFALAHVLILLVVILEESDQEISAVLLGIGSALRAAFYTLHELSSKAKSVDMAI